MPKTLKFAAILALLALPVLELALFIRISRWAGIVPLALAVIFSALAGLAIIRQQGLQTAIRAMRAVQNGGSGLEAMLDGLLRITAGVLLLLPGFLTDVAGLMLLIPKVRAAIVGAGLDKLLRGFAADGGFGSDGNDKPHQSDEPQPRGRHGPVIIEGEYERIDETRDQRPGRGVSKRA